MGIAGVVRYSWCIVDTPGDGAFLRSTNVSDIPACAVVADSVGMSECMGVKGKSSKSGDGGGVGYSSAGLTICFALPWFLLDPFDGDGTGR